MKNKLLVENKDKSGSYTIKIHKSRFLSKRPLEKIVADLLARTSLTGLRSPNGTSFFNTKKTGRKYNLLNYYVRRTL